MPSMQRNVGSSHIRSEIIQLPKNTMKTCTLYTRKRLARLLSTHGDFDHRVAARGALSRIWCGRMFETLKKGTSRRAVRGPRSFITRRRNQPT